MRRLPGLLVSLSPCLLVLLAAGCPGKPVGLPPANPPKGGEGSIGVVVLVDTSGSMKEPVPDKDHHPRPKNQLAGEALAEVLRQAGDWSAKHPDKPLNLSVYSFSDGPRPLLGMGRFDDATTQQAVKNIPGPNGATAIGDALKEAWATLKPVGAERQFILCITDGQNTTGSLPRDVVPMIHRESDGKVEIHFIAFDVKGNLFDFDVKPYNGYVVEASDREQLDRELDRIFRKRILGEGD